MISFNERRILNLPCAEAPAAEAVAEAVAVAVAQFITTMMLLRHMALLSWVAKAMLHGPNVAAAPIWIFSRGHIAQHNFIAGHIRAFDETITHILARRSPLSGICSGLL